MGSILVADDLVQSPIVVVSTDGEIMLFQDVASAEGYLEPVDVKGGEYKAAYDANGRAFDIAVGIQRRRFLGIFPVVLERVELVRKSEPPKHAELTAALRRFLPTLGIAEETVATATLAELLGTAREVAFQK